MACFAIWNFASSFPANYSLTNDTVKLLRNLSSIGWIGFPIALCYFSLAFAKKEAILRNNFLKVIALIILLFFIYKQFTNCLATVPVQQYSRLVTNWSDTIWPYFFYAYYISFTFLAICFIHRYGKKTKKLFEKKQAKIIVVSIFLSLVGESIFDVLIPKLNIHDIPSLANVFLLIFTVAIVYAINKYKFLTITSASAAENIFSSIGDFLFISDEEGIILNVNKATLDSLKYKQNELEGKSVGMLFRKGSFKNELLEKITKGEIIKNYEVDFLTKNEGGIPVLFSSSPLKDKEGNISGNVIIARDIAERKFADEKEKRHLANIAILSQAATKYVSLSADENIYDYICDVIKNLTGAKYIVVNSYNKPSNTLICESFYADKINIEQITRILGRKAEGFTTELDNTIFEGLLSKKNIQIQGGLFELSGKKIPHLLSYTIEKLLDIENVYVMGLSFGNELYGSVALLLQKGDVIENKDIIDAFINQTSAALHRKITKDALKENEEKIKTIIETSPDGIAISSLDGIVQFVTTKTVSMWGYNSADEIIGRNLMEFVHSGYQGKAMSLIADMINGHYTGAAEYLMVRKDGSQFFCESNANILLNSDKNPTGIIYVNRDITDRKQAEKDIHNLIKDLDFRVKQRTAELEEANKELETFSYSISHDLKAPLRRINGFISLFLDNKSTELTEQKLEYLKLIFSSVTEMDQLIDAILSFSQLNNYEMKKTMICSSDMVQQVIKFFEPETQNRKITFNVAFLPDVKADEKLIRQVWTNLISNAIKYTGKKPEAIIDIGSRITNTGITFFVKDNGEGFNMKYAQKLFGVFQRLHLTRDFEGIGIGLANVNRIVTRHGGYCSALGEVGKGATFYFSLPI